MHNKSINFAPLASNALKSPVIEALSIRMNTSSKIDSIARKQKLKKLAIFAAPIIFSILTVLLIISTQGGGDWKQSEVSGLMTSMIPIEMETGNRYIIRVRLYTGEVVQIKVDRYALYSEGKAVILNQSLNTENGAVKYRYLRAK